MATTLKADGCHTAAAPAGRRGARPRRRAGWRRLGAHRLAILVLAACTAAPAAAQDGSAAAGATADFTFQGVVEPVNSVIVANQIDGVVKTVHFEGGEEVAAGDLLVEMDSAAEAIAVEVAQAALAEAEARFALADDAATRAETLRDRGTGSEVSAVEAKGAREIARAVLAGARASLARAELDLSRTRITASIAGQIGRPFVAPGTYVEAEAGTRLAEIVQLDPVLVSYGVPYEIRQKAMAATGGNDVPKMFARLDVRLVLPDGSAYPHVGRPRFESARIDPATGMLTSWGEFANPDGVLVPGLAVTVLSDVLPDGSTAEAAAAPGAPAQP